MPHPKWCIVQPKTHKNYVVSAYIKKADPQTLIHANNDLQETSKNVNEQSAYNDIIDGSQANVNSTDLKTEQQTFSGTKKVNSMPEMSKNLQRYVNMHGSDMPE